MKGIHVASTPRVGLATRLTRGYFEWDYIEPLSGAEYGRSEEHRCVVFSHRMEVVYLFVTESLSSWEYISRY